MRRTRTRSELQHLFAQALSAKPTVSLAKPVSLVHHRRERAQRVLAGL